MEPKRIVGHRTFADKGCSFCVWAPAVEKVELKMVKPFVETVLMEKDVEGYHRVSLEKVKSGARYFYRLDNKLDRPDPASFYQPESVHGPSEVIASVFDWSDSNWFGLPLRDYIIYELHVGTFTKEGTFDAIIPHLQSLVELGITAIEIMPVAQFPGARNWGYDGVGLFAVQNTYGGPAGLKRLVNACHQQGLAVILDVVYNHIGPEGNYLSDFGPYFTKRYSTPWGSALNFDGPDSDAVRKFFIQNALYWQTEFHMDALRLDAVHAINDSSATPFLRELATATRQRSEELNRRFHLIAENDHNDTRYILPQSIGGLGLNAQWSDDFHHSLHVLVTGERNGYYEDFGGIECLEKVYREGYVYTGQRSVHRRRKHGSRTYLNEAKQFVICAQNHDQIGNRLKGDRLSSSLSFAALKLTAATVLLSPFVPLLFMGEEYGETAPFQYFISHTDPQLVEAVRKGRREEFASFGWKEGVPDPQAEETFDRCKLNFALATQGTHRVLREFYRELIRLRKQVSAIRSVEKQNIVTQTDAKNPILGVRYPVNGDEVFLLFSFAETTASTTFLFPRGKWRKILDSESSRWCGKENGTPDEISSDGELTFNLNSKSVLVFQKV